MIEEKLAIIGGSGLYDISNLEVIKEHKVFTPFGEPSDLIVEGRIANSNIFFLPRHGRKHSLIPSEINYRANIFALKKLGVRKIISVSACGSLHEEIKRGDFVIPNDYFDFTLGGKRDKTFFGDSVVAHITSSDISCPILREDLFEKAIEEGLNIHKNKTYACVEGPRLGTKAESFFLKQANCDIVGMTNIPEVFLAREAQISYATLGVVTDYDCWKEGQEVRRSRSYYPLSKKYKKSSKSN